MLSFLSEIATKSGLPFDILNSGFRVVNFSNKSVYIEGIKNIVTFENTEVVLKLKKGIVSIKGNDLKIQNLNLETLQVNGNILSMEIS